MRKTYLRRRLWPFRLVSRSMNSTIWLRAIVFQRLTSRKPSSSTYSRHDGAGRAHDDRARSSTSTAPLFVVRTRNGLNGGSCSLLSRSRAVIVHILLPFFRHFISYPPFYVSTLGPRLALIAVTGLRIGTVVLNTGAINCRAVGTTRASGISNAVAVPNVVPYR